MDKIYKNLYPQIYDLFNLWVAFTKASKGRRSHPSIATFEYNLEPELIRLRDELRAETYLPFSIFHYPSGIIPTQSIVNRQSEISNDTILLPIHHP